MWLAEAIFRLQFKTPLYNEISLKTQNIAGAAVRVTRCPAKGV